MGKSKQRRPPPSLTTDTTDPTESTDTVIKDKVHKSGLYDTNQIKRLLDDHVLTHFESLAPPSTIVINIRIVLGAIAVIAAVYSHFGPGQFPGNRTVVLSCVAIYLVCMAIINLTAYLVEGSAMYVGGGKWVSTSMDRGTSSFCIDIRESVRGNIVSNTQLNYETFITCQGTFLSHSFHHFLVHQLDKKSR